MADKLFSDGADVRWTGPGRRVGWRASLEPGVHAVVVDAGRHRVRSFGTLRSYGVRVPRFVPRPVAKLAAKLVIRIVHRPRRGVGIRLADETVVRVRARDLEIVPPPDHPLQPAPDAEAARWWMRSLATRSLDPTIAEYVPTALPAVCRVLHPFRDEADNEVRWQDVNERLGSSGLEEFWRRLSPAGERVTDLIGSARFGEPHDGELTARLAEALIAQLAPATTTPDDVYVAIWRGWGDVPPQRFPGAAMLDTPNRGHFLLRGQLTGVLTTVAATPFNRPASGLWWPADRAWFVHSEVDFPWTFVAGSEALIQSLVDGGLIEALRVTRADAATRLSSTARGQGRLTD